MNSDISQRLTHHSSKQPTQMQLFPFDPWGAEQVFSVLEHPCPEIARAMIGPLSLGCLVEPADYPLRCLAVTANGNFAACVNLSTRQLRDQTGLWQRVVCELDTAKRQPISSTGRWLGVTPNDCLKRWSAPTFWVPPPHRGDPVHGSVRSLARLLAIRELAATPRLNDDDRITIEKEAAVAVANQIVAGVRHVLSGLDSELIGLLSMRSRISLSLVYRLMVLAKQHGPSAAAYMLQALKTESLGVLHLAASGSPEKESIQVRDAIFNGRSLPDTLAGFGVAKAAHRRSLRKLNSSATPAQDIKADLSELPLSGGNWLTVMRLIKSLPFQGAKDWEELCSLVTKLLSLDFKRTATVPKLLRWCVMHGYQRCSHRLDLLVAKARAIKTATAGLADMDVTLDEAISLAMEQVDELLRDRHHRHTGNALLDELLEIQQVGQLVLSASAVSGKSIDQLMGSISDAHPGVPSWFQVPGATSVQALTSIRLVVEHGIDCSNCLQDAETAIQHVTDGLALYAVKVEGFIEGTIALRFYRFGESPEVLVWDVAGMDNADPSPELSRLAQDLAASWATEAQQACWVAHERACERWNRSLS